MSDDERAREWTWDMDISEYTMSMSSKTEMRWMDGWMDGEVGYNFSINDHPRMHNIKKFISKQKKIS